MTRQEFERLRKLHRKRIDVDIKFEADGRWLRFKNVSIFNEDGWSVLLNGSFRPDTKTIVYNVVLEGTGPICRVCVNNTIHGDCGRSHKHSLSTEDCPRQNLAKDVVRRDELEGLTARQVFEDFCARARIHHAGQFFDPEGT